MLKFEKEKNSKMLKLCTFKKTGPCRKKAKKKRKETEQKNQKKNRRKRTGKSKKNRKNGKMGRPITCLPDAAPTIRAASGGV